MPRQDDISYFLRRSAQERAAAAAVIDPSVRRIHLELSDRYALRARSAHRRLADEAILAVISMAKSEDDRELSISDRSGNAPTVSILPGAAVGLIAGVLASFAMDRFQAAVTALSTDKAADRISQAMTGHSLAASDRPLGGQLVHYALGAGLGALYGIAAEYRHDFTMGYGTMFGIGVATLLDETAVPAVGLSIPPWQTDVGTHAYSLTSHLVYGTVLELARRQIGSMLGPAETRTAPDKRTVATNPDKRTLPG